MDIQTKNIMTVMIHESVSGPNGFNTIFVPLYNSFVFQKVKVLKIQSVK